MGASLGKWGRLTVWAFGVSWLLAVYGVASAQDVPLPPGITKVQTVEDITEYRLPNGLKVLLAPDPSNDRVHVNLTYMVGSRHEGYGEGGMAHLLEHMIFKGTPTTADPKAEFRKRGFTFNGTTNHDRTDYFATFAANQDSLNWYLGWQADAMVNSFIARKDLDSEMTVVRNEFEIRGNNAFQILSERMDAATYNVHSYGKPIIGNRADIERVDIAQLQAFYRRYYRPDNAMLTVSGKFDVAATLTAIHKAFGPLVRPATPVPPTYTLEPVQDGEREVVLRRPSAAQMLRVGYRTVPSLHADSVALSLLATVLSDVPAGRLHQALVESKLAQNIFAFSSSQRESGTLSVGTTFGPQDEAAKRRELLLKITETLAQNPVTPAEFERAKAKLIKGLELGFANAEAVTRSAVHMEVMGDWRAVFVMRDRVNTVTLDDVNRVARTYLVPSNRVIGLLVPTKDPLRAPEPKPLDIAAYLQGHVFKEKGLESLPFDFSVASLNEKVRYGTTPGGIKTAVLVKPVRGDLVTLHIGFKMGSLESLSGQDAAAAMARPMLLMGTTRMNRQQLQDELVRLGAAVNMSFGERGGSLHVTVKKDKFQETLQLCLHALKDSTFPEKEFEEVRAAQIKALEGQIKDPSAQANNAWGRYGNPYPKTDPRYRHTLEEWLHEVRTVTRAQALDFYRRFYGAQNAQVSLIGPVDAEASVKTLVSELDAWRAPQAWSRVPEPLRDKKPARLIFNTPDKSNTHISAYQGLPIQGRQFSLDEYAMALGSRILGGGPGSRLHNRLREKDGLSYSVQAGFSASSYEPTASISLSAEVAPQNLSAAEAALRDELTRSVKDGFNAEEVASFKKQWLADRVRSRSGDSWASSVMAGRLEHNDAPNFVERSDALIESLTAEQVNTVWRKFVQPDKLVWGIFGDEAKFK